MQDNHFAGALLRMHRLEKNWSQETLCSGICAVSYLSKIEQGRVQANDSILAALFAKLNINWTIDPAGTQKAKSLCDQAYEMIFSRQWDQFSDITSLIEESWRELAYGAYYLDLICIRAFMYWDAAMLPMQMVALLDARQRSLICILQKDFKEAVRRYPCALTVMLYGADQYAHGAYTSALEQLQRAYDLASREGYVRIMLFCQLYMSNAYSDLHDMPQMELHSKIAIRLARILKDTHMEATICYNIHSTQIECGEYESAYAYFSSLNTDEPLSLHKLAVCCERLCKLEEAKAAIDRAMAGAEGLEKRMCELVCYRLEHKDYLKDANYGTMLMNTFRQLREERSAGYARFHLPWVEEWCTANRQYRLAYELLKDFT